MKILRKHIFYIILVCLLLCVSVIYYLNVEREIEIYKEYSINSDEETGGIVWSIINSEMSRKKMMVKYKIKIPEVDFSKYYLLWSSGRRIKKITYRIISKYKWWYGVPKGIAVFGEKYYPHTAFFYKIDKVLVMQDWLERDKLLQEMKRSGKVK